MFGKREGGANDTDSMSRNKCRVGEHYVDVIYLLAYLQAGSDRCDSNFATPSKDVHWNFAHIPPTACQKNNALNLFLYLLQDSTILWSWISTDIPDHIHVSMMLFTMLSS